MTSSPKSSFSDTLSRCLATERLDAYRSDGADEQLALARYLLNMALSEALYPVLQFGEIALRNAMHQALTARIGSEQWYDSPQTRLTGWQQDNVRNAKQSLRKEHKPLSSGRIVAELNFGFWTGFFNKVHARTGLGHYLTKQVFSHAPKSERDLTKQDTYWSDIRRVRNRVFHHERILHWKDLDTQHARMLTLIAWIDPQLKQLAESLDRFLAIRRGGLGYWLEQAGSLFSKSIPQPAKIPSWAVVDDAIDYDGEESPFGNRWSSGVTPLNPTALTALAQGKWVACDVRGEYIHYLKLETSHNA